MFIGLLTTRIAGINGTVEDLLGVVAGALLVKEGLDKRKEKVEE